MAQYRTAGFPVTIVRPSHTYCGGKAVVALHGACGGWQTLARIRAGKPVIIPGDGVLNEFLARHRLLSVEGAVVLDGLGVLFHHAAFLVRARRAGCLDISRRLLYARPTDAMRAHARDAHRMTPRDEREFSGRLR